MEKIKKAIRNNKKRLIWIIIIIVIAGIGAQLILFYTSSMKSHDISINSIDWTFACEGENYSIEDKINFCEKCQNVGNCSWPIDINLTINNINQVKALNGEIHCFLVIDNTDYYKEKGSYYGIERQDFFTYILEDASKNHQISFCCGIEHESSVSTILQLNKPVAQACISQDVKAMCKKELPL